MTQLEKLRALPSHLRTHIKGQDHVTERVSSVLTRGELGLTNPKRPKGSFLFVGPTGVGKTEITQLFTGYLFDGAKPLRFDMSEYQLQSSIDKLIGGSLEERGLLGRALQGVGRGTLLFDEIEKGHPLVLDLLLQLLDDGRITLATGETLNLAPFYVVCTSNIGSAEAMRMQSAPFASIERTVMSRVGQELRPELVGRMTEKIVFNRLPFAIQREICEQMVATEVSRLRTLGWDITVEPRVLELLIREGYHKTVGARPMRGTVERRLQEAVAAQAMGEGSRTFTLVADNDRILTQVVTLTAQCLMA